MYTPVVLTLGRFKFLIYVNDHSPAHVHVKAVGAEAKLYLSSGQCFWAREFDQKTLNCLEKMVTEHSQLLWEVWNEYHKKEV